MLLLGGNIMRGMEKLEKELLFPVAEQLLFLTVICKQENLQDPLALRNSSISQRKNQKCSQLCSLKPYQTKLFLMCSAI